MTNDAKVHALTILLARGSFALGNLVKSSDVPVPYHLTINATSTGELYIQPPKANPPGWAEFFDGYIPSEDFGKNSAAGAALLVTIRDKHFAITFGSGRFLLNSDCWEERFGLKVVLNCIGEDTVRSIDKHSLDQLLRHTREQASRDATPGEFGFDIEQDLLKAVTGKPVDRGLGQRISGSDSLHLTIPIHLNQLPELLDTLSDRFADTSYRIKFPWVDQIAELADSRLERELDALLVTRLVSGATDHIWMAVPELISWDKVSGFRFPARTQSPEYHDIHLDFFLRSIGNLAALNTETLRARRVVSVDHDGRKLSEWSAYKCVYAELEHNSESFILSSGKWYRVKSDFVRETNKAYDRISNYEGALPEFADDSEGTYLRRVVKSDPKRFALMDQQMVPYGDGHSTIEFCDLVTADKDIFHVKRYGQASALSHLFAQGLVSGELFQVEQKFRREVNKKLPKEYRLRNPKDRPRQNEFRVIFAVISDRPDDLRLPFFSRLNLKHAAKRLEAYGFRVAKAKISINDAFSRTARFQRRTREKS